MKKLIFVLFAMSKKSAIFEIFNVILKVSHY